jgi:hypothetical protein
MNKAEKILIIFLLIYFSFISGIVGYLLQFDLRMKMQEEWYEEKKELYTVIFYLDRQIGQYERLEIFVDTWLFNETVYRVTESKKGYLNGSCPILMQTTSGFWALWFAIGHCNGTITITGPIVLDKVSSFHVKSNITVGGS